MRYVLMLTYVVFSLILVTQCDELKFVIELYRHGSRGPLPDQYQYDVQKYQRGQLLPSGMREHFIFGQQLRKEYIEDKQYLSPNYNWTQIWVRAADVNRTLMSAGSHLYGLYPPGTGPNLPADLPDIYQIPPYGDVQPLDIGNAALPNGYQPIPINSVAGDKDTIFNPDVLCPRYIETLGQFYTIHSDTLAYIDAQFSKTSQTLNQLLNRTITTIDDYEGIYDGFISDYYQGWPLPPNLTQEVWNNVTFYDTFHWWFDYGDVQGRRLVTTPILDLYIQNLDAIVQNGTNYPSKWFSLSGHDSNVAPVAAALNFSSWECQFDLWFQGSTDALNCVYRPYFAASILVELYQNDTSKEFYVQVKYNGDYQYLCQQKSIVCSYTEFRSRIKNWVVPDFEKACLPRLLQPKDIDLLNLAKEFAHEKIGQEGMLLTFIIQLIIICFLICKIFKRKQLTKQCREVSNFNHSNDQYIVSVI